MATLFKRPNGYYYLISESGGKRIWRSTGARTKAEARKIVSQDFKSEPAPVAQHTLSSFSNQFLSYAETNFAPGTILLYAHAAKTFARHAGDKTLTSYTIQDVENFKAKRAKEV